MKKNYTGYNMKKLLDDDYFIDSIIHPKPESKEFWSILLSEGIIDPDEFEQAGSFIQFLQKPSSMMTSKEKNELLLTIEIKNKKILRKNFQTRKFYLYGIVASLLIAVFSMTYFLLDLKKDPSRMQPEVAVSVDKNSNNIQLLLSGAKNPIELKDATVDIVLNKEGNVVANSKRLNEIRAEDNDNTMAYNQLIVPFGKHSSLTLADGTKIHVNSGTKVSFPDKFKGKTREIYVNGEIFLEVAPNANLPFIVHTNKLEVSVQGTSFNVRAYDQDEKESVVLVTGLVKVHTKENHETQLFPNQKMDYSGGNYSVSSVNAYDYISWKDGYLIYKSEQFGEILKQLSRYYGIVISCDQNLSALKCSGKLDLKESPDKVIKDLADIFQLNVVSKNETEYLFKNINN